jgi:hypothetical protein
MAQVWHYLAGTRSSLVHILDACHVETCRHVPCEQPLERVHAEEVRRSTQVLMRAAPSRSSTGDLSFYLVNGLCFGAGKLQEGRSVLLCLQGSKHACMASPLLRALCCYSLQASCLIIGCPFVSLCCRQGRAWGRRDTRFQKASVTGQRASSL